MPPTQTVTAAVLIIGNEVLSGRTHEANLPYIATSLNGAGVRVMEARVIRDEEAAIIAAVNACRTTYDYVFTTGGIGPTHDDITSASVAAAFGVPVIRDPRAVAMLAQRYRPEELNEARLKMAEVPEGSELLDNPVSKAPGFRLGNVFVLPGVPSIMRAMLDGVLPGLRGGAPVLSRTVSAYITEGAIAEPLARVQASHPDVEIGSYPFARDRRFGVSLVVRSADAAALERAAEEVRALVEAAGGEPIEDAPVVV